MYLVKMPFSDPVSKKMDNERNQEENRKFRNENDEG